MVSHDCFAGVHQIFLFIACGTLWARNSSESRFLRTSRELSAHGERSRKQGQTKQVGRLGGRGMREDEHGGCSGQGEKGSSVNSIQMTTKCQETIFQKVENRVPLRELWGVVCNWTLPRTGKGVAEGRVLIEKCEPPA